jgi:hypothetical protein
MNKIESLDDLSPMLFGKFGKLPMQDVPVNYLNWLWHNTGMKSIDPNKEPEKEHHKNNYKVAMYIRKNLEALKMEDEDLIW